MHGPDKPVLVMGYANQFLGPRGERAIADAAGRRPARRGAIVADLTPDEGAPLEAAFEDQGLALVYLVAPTSPPERIALIGERSGGFVYCVSLTGVTGARVSGPTRLAALVGRASRRDRSCPVAVGFGVCDPTTCRPWRAQAPMASIVGSALIDALGADGRDVESFTELCAALADATSRVDLAA